MRSVLRPLLLAPLLLLGGCLFAGDGDDDFRAPPRWQPSAWQPAPDPRDTDTRACLVELSREHIRYEPLPDQSFGPGCALSGAVRLIDIGVPVTGLKGVRCGLAQRFAAWARNGVAPAARQILGSDVVRIETWGSYACRNVVGNPAVAARRSGHAIGNAIDVAAFVLADGRRVTVEQGWQSPDAREREFLAVVHRSACRRFGTVLGPEYNTAHRNHFHLEDDAARFCR